MTSFKKPLLPPTVQIGIGGIEIDLTKVKIGNSTAFIGRPVRGTERSIDPLIVYVSGEELTARGKLALCFIDPASPNAMGVAICELLAEHLASRAWDETDWRAVREDVVQYFGGTVEVSDRPEAMTEDEERLLAHMGASEQIIQICLSNHVRPLPSPRRYLQELVGSDRFAVVEGGWTTDAQLIAITQELRATDVDLAKRFGLLFTARKQKAA